MQSLYAFHTSPDQTINLAEKELFHSINKSYDLYHLMLQLLIDVQKFAVEQIDLRKKKNFPTDDDLHPNTRFINNIIIQKVIENKPLQDYVNKQKLSWFENHELIKRLYTELCETEEYINYMSNPDHHINKDRDIVEYFYANIIAESDDIHQLLEEKSIYWNDDLEFVISMIIKTLSKFKQSTPDFKTLMPLFKDNDDLEFTKTLFRKTVLNSTEHREIIKNHLRNWDLDRVAFIDVLIMEMALSEFMYFPSIPSKVTMNEYIDLAKYYSTSKSQTFINGVLDKIHNDLKREGKIVKTGRGLIGENKVE